MANDELEGLGSPTNYLIVPPPNLAPLPNSDSNFHSPSPISTPPSIPRRPDLSKSPASRSRPSPRPARSTSSLRTPRKLVSPPSPPLNPPTLTSSVSTTYISQDPFVPVFNLPKPVVCPSIPVANEWPPAPYGSENVPDLESSALAPVAMNEPSPALLGDLNSSGKSDRGASPVAYPQTELAQRAWPSDAKDDDGLPVRERPSLAAAPSLTLSLFTHLNDPNLSWQRKLGCFGATLAINLFLPFMNGIMLGFGEIAAREIVGSYLGWGPSSYRHQTRPSHRTSLENTNRQSDEDELLQSSNPTALFIQSELAPL